LGMVGEEMVVGGLYVYYKYIICIFLKCVGRWAGGCLSQLHVG
jgi:hypothetical protein